MVSYIHNMLINYNTALSIAAGVPYRVRVYAENINGRGSYCITTDFGDQLSTYMHKT